MLYLKQKETNRIYVYTEALSKRDDMEPYIKEDERRDFSNLQQSIDEAPSAAEKDWRKIMKKSDFADYAKMHDDIVLDQEQTLSNMRAQYVAATQAKENCENVLAAIDAQARTAD